MDDGGVKIAKIGLDSFYYQLARQSNINNIMDILKLEYRGKDNQLLKSGSKYEVCIRISGDCIVVSISQIDVGTYTSLVEFLKSWCVN